MDLLVGASCSKRAGLQRCSITVWPRFGLLVVCVETRQACQALKSLPTHKTDRDDARGLAHLARTGFFKAVHVKSLPAHAIRSLIIARKKLVGRGLHLRTRSAASPWCSVSGCPAR
jgi:hypothetical protein